MRILLLIPGTGSFLCGSCLRDHALGRGLRALGHDAVMSPLYLPFELEEPVPEQPVHMGGLNMYLQQHFPLARRMPRKLHDLLDAPRLLRRVSAMGDMTDAHGLGEMTLATLRGEHGAQAHELELLLEWLGTIEPPDAVILSNAMLLGIARSVKRAVDAPVLVTLQGEMPFLDALSEPHRERAWDEVRERAADVDAFVPVSAHYGEAMRARIGFPLERMHVVPNGIDLEDFAGEPGDATERPPTLGYLARMCADKGLPTLVEAFIALRRRGTVDGLRLRAAGVVLRGDRPLVERLQQRLRAEGLLEDVELLPNVDRATKLAFLRELSLLSVPATYGESFGLYVLEALAAGVPVVQPEHGAFPELIAATGGGILCAPDDPEALADACERLLLDPRRARELAARGRRAVFERFGAEHMARGVERVCTVLTSGGLRERA